MMVDNSCDNALYDWADVAAVGLLAFDPDDGSPLLVRAVVSLLDYQEQEYRRECMEDDPEASPMVLLAEHRRIAAALREAFEAGRKEGEAMRRDAYHVGWREGRRCRD